MTDDKHICGMIGMMTTKYQASLSPDQRKILALKVEIMSLEKKLSMYDKIVMIACLAVAFSFVVLAVAEMLG